ncbi:MTH538 TIR-like domain [Fibrobacter sp. UWOV1]|uniref:TIR domain-containing protein n=1 Tax=Fibrobacter sp. UWOV1 TaxID=1896215 RepID=UPI00091B54C5|nr:TIR domain-containing protein [Fibrobacter sp. UWOV1]SHL78391.1 MTH538 TIR-like domain [Fibrobacter sp. UWOV1]
MEKKRTFISFDYDHDKELKECLVGQARNPDSPFEITDMSIKEKIDDNWKKKARNRIKGCDVVVVICGEHTDTATGVTAELTIAQEEKIPYFLLKGHPDKVCKKPNHALASDTIYKWTWDILKLLFQGKR